LWEFDRARPPRARSVYLSSGGRPSSRLAIYRIRRAERPLLPAGDGCGYDSPPRQDTVPDTQRSVYSLRRCSRPVILEHLDHPAAMSPRALIAHLQESVQAWIDSDRVLPADGASLLAMLNQAFAALAAEDAPAARAGIMAFTGQFTALIAAGVLSAGDGQP